MSQRDSTFVFDLQAEKVQELVNLKKQIALKISLERITGRVHSFETSYSSDPSSNSCDPRGLNLDHSHP